MPRKAYNAPFRIMVFITLFVIITNTGAYMFMANDKVTNHLQRLPVNLLIVLWPSLLLAETITYRLIRHKTKPDKFVRIHVFSNLICFFVIPMMYIFFNLFFSRMVGNGNYFKILQPINQIRFYAFWGLLIVGHAFFITTIVNIFKSRDTPDTNNEQPPGILDGILDEY